MTSREWMTISTSTFFQESTIYSYSEWKDKKFQDYEKKECKVSNNLKDIFDEIKVNNSEKKIQYVLIDEGQFFKNLYNFTILCLEKLKINVIVTGLDGDFQRKPMGEILNLLPGYFWFLLKVAILLFLFLWVRATLPRYRYDQLMRLGWKVFLPLSLAWIIITSSVVIYLQN